MKSIESINEIKAKLTIGEKLNISESDEILRLINRYEFGIKTAEVQ